MSVMPTGNTARDPVLFVEVHAIGSRVRGPGYRDVFLKKKPEDLTFLWNPVFIPVLETS
jgi:hypothetical protein